jgi:single-strand DNA-binding protein
MRGINKVILVGTVGSDPDIKHLSSGTLANLSVATSEQWKDKTTGEKREKTEWHKVVCFGKLAEIIEKYVKKGSKIYAEGSLNTREWLDKDSVKHYSTQVVVSDLQMLNDARTAVKSPYVASMEQLEELNNDIPF